MLNRKILILGESLALMPVALHRDDPRHCCGCLQSGVHATLFYLVAFQADFLFFCCRVKEKVFAPAKHRQYALIKQQTQSIFLLWQESRTLYSSSLTWGLCIFITVNLHQKQFTILHVILFCILVYLIPQNPFSTNVILCKYHNISQYLLKTTIANCVCTHNTFIISRIYVTHV